MDVLDFINFEFFGKIPNFIIDMSLKRLFKSRAKKLQERAESLMNNQFEDLLGEVSLKSEEEKDFKNIEDPHPPKIIMEAEPCCPKKHAIDLGTAEEKDLPKHKLEDREEVKENTKEEEEVHKLREERNMLCGLKRSRSFSNKEEFESSLKDFTCTICMDYMVGAKKLNCGHCFCNLCISFWFLREKFCPICKEKVRDEKNAD